MVTVCFCGVSIKSFVEFKSIKQTNDSNVCTFRAPLGKNVSLDCYIEALPPPINYWLNDSIAIFATNDKYEISVKEKGYKRHLRLTILQLQDKDLGNYHCFAKNALGEHRATIKLYGQ